MFEWTSWPSHPEFLAAGLEGLGDGSRVPRIRQACSAQCFDANRLRAVGLTAAGGVTKQGVAVLAHRRAPVPPGHHCLR